MTTLSQFRAIRDERKATDRITAIAALAILACDGFAGFAGWPHGIAATVLNMLPALVSILTLAGLMRLYPTTTFAASEQLFEMRNLAVQVATACVGATLAMLVVTGSFA